MQPGKNNQKKVRSGMESDDTLAVAIADSLARLAAGDLSARDRIIELCSDRLRVLDELWVRWTHQNLPTMYEVLRDLRREIEQP